MQCSPYTPHTLAFPSVQPTRSSPHLTHSVTSHHSIKCPLDISTPPSHPHLNSTSQPIISSHHLISGPQRASMAERAEAAGAPSQLPPALLRRFDVYLRPRAKAERVKLRGVSAHNIGHLVKLRVGAEFWRGCLECSLKCFVLLLCGCTCRKV